MLVNLPMSPGCGDWIVGLFYGDDQYRVAGFWRRDINSAFISTSFGWLFIHCGLSWSCFAGAFVLIMLAVWLFYLLLLFIRLACTTRNPPYPVFILHLRFLCTWTARHLIIWRTASTWSAILIESESVISYLEGFLLGVAEVQHLALCSLISFLFAPDVSLHKVRLYWCFFGLWSDINLTVEDFLGNWTVFNILPSLNLFSYKRH